MQRHWSTSFILITMGLLSGCQDAPPAPAFRSGADAQNLSSLALNGPAAKLWQKQERDWINLTGTATAVHPGAFTLDYGQGTVRVEMDDWYGTQEKQRLIAGDRVTVTGRVDKDVNDRKLIEARSVFVERLNTHIQAGAVDEESLRLR